MAVTNLYQGFVGMLTGRKLISLAFLVSATALAVVSVFYLRFDKSHVLFYFLIPYYIATTAVQYLAPFQQNVFEKGEVWNDVLNNVGAVLMGVAQTALSVALVAYTLPSVLVTSGLIDPRYTLAAMPLGAQVLVILVVSDFLFYWAHRLAHEVDFLWRFHSVHHCAHRISVLNASRVHPIDLVFRRIVPMVITLQLTGASPEAVLITGTAASVLGTITHMNVDTDFGALSYLIGTNQNHRWHHSTVYDEAKNFGLTTIWDHLFGTFYLPRDRSRPEQFGLSDERHYPLHSYVGQLLIPFRWSKWTALQAASDAAAAADTCASAATDPDTGPGAALSGGGSVPAREPV